MNIVEERDLIHYGYRPSKNCHLALRMLKSYQQDEFKSLASPEREYSGEPPVFACRFCKVPSSRHLLALANEDGMIRIQDTSVENESNPNKICIQGHMNAIFDLAWADNSLRLASVSGDHTAILWDVSDQAMAPLAMFEGHTRSVKVACFRPYSNNMFATGARDGVVVIWDYRCAQPNATTIKPDNIVPNAHCQPGGSSVKKIKRNTQPSRAESITGLVFQDENYLISCSAGDGFIKVWDIRKCYSICVGKKLPQACYSLPYPGCSAKNSFTSLSLDPGGVRLFANCMDNNIYCYNVATYEKTPVATYTGHQNLTFYVKSCLSSDGQYLLSGSSDEKGYLWHVKKPGMPVAQLTGHNAEVTCVDWANSCDVKVVTCADDSSYRLWRVSPPTDSCDGLNPKADTDLIGWTEFLDKSSSDSQSLLFTPRSMKRLARRQDFTPGYSDLKRQKTESGEDEEINDRNVLSSVQPRTDGKGARRLFETDGASFCNGVEILSPTSNLPNYVIEGTSPFHRCSSSASKQKENWLARLQTTPSPQQAKKITPKRRVHTQTHNTSKATSNLLRFFTVSKPNLLNSNTCQVQKESPLPKESQAVI